MKTYAVRKKENGYQVVWFHSNSYFTNNGYGAYEREVVGAFCTSRKDAENEDIRKQTK